MSEQSEATPGTTPALRLLRTKLYIPRAHPELVERPWLSERLNEGLYHKLTLVSAPAGFGKTTLLSSWIALNRFQVAWLSLDERDNDPTRYGTLQITKVYPKDLHNEGGSE